MRGESVPAYANLLSPKSHPAGSPKEMVHLKQHQFYSVLAQNHTWEIFFASVERFTRAFLLE